MAYAIPLNGQNIYMAAAIADISVDEIITMQRESEKKFRKDKDREWAIDLLCKDEKWYEETLLKIEELKKRLPDDLDYRERTKKLYGWIAKDIKNVNLSIPMELDTEYSKADCINLILTNPDMYLKIINWD